MHIARPLSAALLALASLTPALAASVTISVTGADGKPAADTVVMLRRPGGFQGFDVREVPVITQKDIRFSPYVTVVPPRGTVRFVNQDNFAHHLRSMPSGPMGSVPPSQEFEYRMAAARGNNYPSAELKVESSGAIVLGCHLHGSMRAHIFVTPTPWYAITDDKGQARIEVPDGPATLALWHPDQLGEQPGNPVQIAGDGQLAQALNFTPRKRPAPRAAPKSDYDPYYRQ